MSPTPCPITPPQMTFQSAMNDFEARLLPHHPTMDQDDDDDAMQEDPIAYPCTLDQSIPCYEKFNLYTLLDYKYDLNKENGLFK